MKSLRLQDFRWFVHSHTAHYITELVLHPRLLSPSLSFPYTHWPLICHPWSVSSVILMFTFLPKAASMLASWGSYFSLIQPVTWLIQPTWPSYQHCRKMPKVGAQNCSSLSERVRKMYYMVFLSKPSKTIKRSENML